MSVMGIDYGEKRVGLAFADEVGVALPYDILPNDVALVPALKALIEERNVHTTVIGESKTYDGEDNPIMARARALADTLRQKAGVEVVFSSETLTTFQARRLPGKEEKNRSPAKNSWTRKPADAAAAAIILQSYLDKHGTHLN